VYALNLVAVAMGLSVAPLRTLRAFAAARGARTLFRAGLDYDALLETSLGDLRARLGLPREGLARSPRRLHDAVEGARADAMPSAPPLTGGRLAVAVASGAATTALGAAVLAVVGFGGLGAWLALAATGLGAVLVAGALAAHKGSLGARAGTGHAALALAATAIGAAVLAAPFAALAALPAFATLAALAKA